MWCSGVGVCVLFAWLELHTAARKMKKMRMRAHKSENENEQQQQVHQSETK